MGIKVPEGYRVEETPGQAPKLFKKESKEAVEQATGISYKGFIDLVGDDITLQIMAAAKIEPKIELALDKLKTAEGFDRTEPAFKAILDTFVEKADIEFTEVERDKVIQGIPLHG